MTPEERQRLMDFIIQQQAEFTTDIHKLQESQRGADERMTKLEGIVTRLANASLQRLETHDAEISNLDSKMAALVDAQIKSEEKITALTEAQTNLTAVVNRYFSEGRKR